MRLETPSSTLHRRGLRAAWATASLTLAALLNPGLSWAGPYAPAAGKPGSTAISKDSSAFVQWATGYQDYLPGPNVDATWKTPEKALGKAQGTSTDIVVLGDAGRITLTFGGSIFNGRIGISNGLVCEKPGKPDSALGGQPMPAWMAWNWRLSRCLVWIRPALTARLALVGP